MYAARLRGWRGVTRDQRPRSLGHHKRCCGIVARKAGEAWPTGTEARPGDVSGGRWDGGRTLNPVWFSIAPSRRQAALNCRLGHPSLRAQTAPGHSRLSISSARPRGPRSPWVSAHVCSTRCLGEEHGDLLGAAGRRTAVFRKRRKVCAARRAPFLPQSEGIEGGLSTSFPLRSRSNTAALVCHRRTRRGPSEADRPHVASDRPLGAPGVPQRE